MEVKKGACSNAAVATWTQGATLRSTSAALASILRRPTVVAHADLKGDSKDEAHGHSSGSGRSLQSSRLLAATAALTIASRKSGGSAARNRRQGCCSLQCAPKEDASLASAHPDGSSRARLLRGSSFASLGGLVGCGWQPPSASAFADSQPIRKQRLGASDIYVSECGLGTQRWASADFNAPDEALCRKMLNRAVLERGVNLVDTAEQYPIPSDSQHPEGRTEEVIGNWLAQDKTRREKLVIATKITGGLNVKPENIRADLEESLKRLKTDYIDLYLTHWSFRISQPQQNWGQSLQYRQDLEPIASFAGQPSFEEIVKTFGELVAEGKIRGWGCCNESSYGATRLVVTAKAMGVATPCVFQNDYSIINRRCEENGLFEMCSPYNENVGFMAYNVLAGGMLTGKYVEEPAAVDIPDLARAKARVLKPRGRMDDIDWGNTLYRYRSAPAIDATKRYADLAKTRGMSLTELSLRWAKQRAGVSTCLVGCSSLDQLNEDLQAFSKTEPLPDGLLWDIDRVHMRNRLPIFSSQDVGQDWGGYGEIGEPIP